MAKVALSRIVGGIEGSMSEEWVFYLDKEFGIYLKESIYEKDDKEQFSAVYCFFEVTLFVIGGQILPTV